MIAGFSSESLEAKRNDTYFKCKKKRIIYSVKISFRGGKREN